MNTILSELDSLRDRYHSQLQERAADYRCEVLVPLCQKRNLHFTQGMGTFFFHPAGIEPGQPEYWTASDIDEMLAVEGVVAPNDVSYVAEVFLLLDVLDWEFEPGAHFGFLVDDFDGTR